MNWEAPILGRRKRLERLGWHLWFAWYPVRVRSGRWYWLEHVKRQCFWAQGYYAPAYREPSWEPRPELSFPVSGGFSE